MGGESSHTHYAKSCVPIHRWRARVTPSSSHIGVFFRFHGTNAKNRERNPLALWGENHRTHITRNRACRFTGGEHASRRRRAILVFFFDSMARTQKIESEIR